MVKQINELRRKNYLQKTKRIFVFSIKSSKIVDKKIIPIRYKTKSAGRIQSSDFIQKILQQHKIFQKFQPFSPLATSPQPKVVSTEILPKNFINRCDEKKWVFSKKVAKVSSVEETIQRCVSHVSEKPFKFCIHCFFENYLGSNFYNDLESRRVARKFKNSQFVFYEDQEFLIEGTEIPLYDLHEKTINENVIASCKKHIFSPPQKPCDTCFWINYLKH